MFYATISGNLGGNAETKQVGTDSVTTFSVASSRKVKGEEKTTWARCNLWGKRGEALSQYLTKGTPVTVIGDLSTSQYEKDGTTRFSLDIRVSDIKLQGSTKHDEKPAASYPNSWDQPG